MARPGGAGRNALPQQSQNVLGERRMARETTGRLFEEPEDSVPALPDAPLAERMRPRNLAEFVGQAEVIGETSILGKALKHGDCALVAHPLGTAGHGQDHAGPLARRAEQSAVHRTFRGPFGRARGSCRDRPGAEEPPPRRQADPLHRRDPSLQQGPARRTSGGRRGRHDLPDRRHHREPLVRGQRRPAVSLPGRRAASRYPPTNWQRSSAAPWRTPTVDLPDRNRDLRPS